MISSDSEGDNIYNVVVEGGEAIHVFPPNIVIPIYDEESQRVNNTITVSTKMVDEGHDEKVPRNILYDCVVETSDLKDAVGIASQDASDIHEYLSFAGNTYGGELIPKLAYDATPGKKERIFWQSWKETISNIPSIQCFVSAREFIPLYKGILNAPEKYRYNVQNAIHHYVGALTHCKEGSEVLAVARLFMAAEALSIAYTKLSIHLLSMQSRDEFAERINLPKQRVESWIRKTVIFGNNEEAHNAAKKVSDGFEHGFARYREIRRVAASSRLTVARLVREAILNILDMDSASREKLASGQGAPTPGAGWVGTCEGVILGESDNLTAEGLRHPYIDYGLSLSAFSKSATGLHISIHLNDNGAKLNPGLTFKRFDIVALESGEYRVSTKEQLERKKRIT